MIDPVPNLHSGIPGGVTKWITTNDKPRSLQDFEIFEINLLENQFVYPSFTQAIPLVYLVKNSMM